MQPILCHLLLIPCLFYTSAGITKGCAVWKLSESGVYCEKCLPGNRLLTRSGKDPAMLCTPCDDGTFVTNPEKFSCDRCNQCKGPRVIKKACTASSDSVCDCKAGLRCGDLQCSYCVDECKKGEEPTEERTCRKCPEGTFNDKIHSKCQPWRTSCPEGQTLVVKGNNSRDNECRGEVATAKPSAFITVDVLPARKPEENMVWPIVGTAGGISVVTIVIILSLAFAHQRIKNKTKVKTGDPMPEMLPPEELRVMTAEQDDSWSFRQPEQEQGGSSESISTQDSETKLIV